MGPDEPALGKDQTRAGETISLHGETSLGGEVHRRGMSAGTG